MKQQNKENGNISHLKRGNTKVSYCGAITNLLTIEEFNLFTGSKCNECMKLNKNNVNKPFAGTTEGNSSIKVDNKK